MAKQIETGVILNGPLTSPSSLLGLGNGYVYGDGYGDGNDDGQPWAADNMLSETGRQAA